MATGNGKAHNWGKGKAYAWIVAHAGHQNEECLPWPFCRDASNGYCRFGHAGKVYWVHRFMCELVNGPPPTGKHEASHTCGKGHEGCVNPQHLVWKTRAENQADRYLHRRKPHRTARHKLTEEQVAEIRRLGPTKKRKELAAMFGVSSGNIRQILLGQIWTTGKRTIGGFTSETAKAARARQAADFS